MDYEHLLAPDFRIHGSPSHDDIVGAADLAAQLEQASASAHASVAGTPIDGTIDSSLGQHVGTTTELGAEGEAEQIGEDGKGTGSEGDKGDGEDGFKPVRGKRGSQAHLSNEEKKERQKQQNRSAAERSRRKRRDEEMALEESLAAKQAENADLRKKLETLLAARNPTLTVASVLASPPTADKPAPAPADPMTVDHAYLSRLQSELEANRATLLTRQLELDEARQDPPAPARDAEVETVRAELLSQHRTFITIDAESRSIQAVTLAINGEKDNLVRQAEIIRREVETRKRVLKVTRPPEQPGVEEAIVVEPDGAGHREVDREADREIDRDLLDIGEWEDAAEKIWDEAAAEAVQE